MTLKNSKNSFSKKQINKNEFGKYCVFSKYFTARLFILKPNFNSLSKVYQLFYLLNVGRYKVTRPITHGIHIFKTQIGL